MVGITISADSGTTFYSGGANYNAIARLGDNTFIVAYADENDSLKGKVIVGTRAGTSITVNSGDVVTFEAGEVMEIGITALTATLFVISYVDVSDSNTVKMVAGTVSGTTITLGDIATSGISGGNDTAICTLDSTHFIISTIFTPMCYSLIGSISGTTITTSGLTRFDDGSAACSKCDVVALNSTDFVNVFNEGGNTIARVGIADIGGSAITMGAKSDYGAYTGAPKVASFDSLHFVIAQYSTVMAGSIDEVTHAITQGSFVAHGMGAGYYSICTMDSTHFIVSANDLYGTPTIGELVAGSLSGSTTLTMDAQGVVTFDTSTISYTTICKLTSDYFIAGFKHA